MVKRARAGMPVGQLAATGFNQCNEFREGARRHRRMDGKTKRRKRDVRDRLKVLEGIVQGPVLEQRLGDMRTGSAYENCGGVRLTTAAPRPRRCRCRGPEV